MCGFVHHRHDCAYIRQMLLFLSHKQEVHRYWWWRRAIPPYLFCILCENRHCDALRVWKWRCKYVWRFSFAVRLCLSRCHKSREQGFVDTSLVVLLCGHDSVVVFVGRCILCLLFGLWLCFCRVVILIDGIFEYLM